MATTPKARTPRMDKARIEALTYRDLLDIHFKRMFDMGAHRSKGPGALTDTYLNYYEKLGRLMSTFSPRWDWMPGGRQRVQRGKAVAALAELMSAYMTVTLLAGYRGLGFLPFNQEDRVRVGASTRLMQLVELTALLRSQDEFFKALHALAKDAGAQPWELYEAYIENCYRVEE